MVRARNIFPVIITLLIINTKSSAQIHFDIESGIVPSLSYNEVRIPGDGGTLFNFEKDFESRPTFYYRLRAGYTFGRRHTVSLLYAPLSINYENGLFQDNIIFNGESFDANTRINGRYKFNSYRLTYRYKIINLSNFEFGAGLTAKIRDAAISLANGETGSEKTDFGFVPLINFYTLWRVHRDAQIIFEGDALASPQGRAIDAFLGIGYNLAGESLRAKAGYRVLEGGADNDEVYNFTWVNFVSVGILFSFL